MSERRLSILAESLKSQCSKGRGKGMFKAFCKTSLFSCLKLHFLKPLLGFYSEDWRQTVGFSGVPLITKQKTLYRENVFLKAADPTESSFLRFCSSPGWKWNNFTKFLMFDKGLFYARAFPSGGALAKPVFTPWLPTFVNSVNFYLTQILLRLDRMFQSC